MMHLSDDGLRFIGKWEGFVGHVYLDAAKKATIGYGHLIRPGEHFTTLTEPEGLALLRQDAALAETAVNACVKVPLTQRQFDALVSLAFNIGNGAFAMSTLCKYLNRGDYSGAASQFLVWDHVGGVENAGLRARRESERAMFGGAPDLTTTRGVQQALNLLGWRPALSEDGVLGPKTTAAVTAWQAAHGLDDDGVVGPKTRAALALELAKIGAK